jgi:two-component system response regulator HydG
MSVAAHALSRSVREAGQFSALIIDDEPEVRAALASVIESAGWAIGEASSLAHARELLARREWSLVFLDKVLPDGEGTNLLPSLIEQGMEVVMLTGQGSADEAIFAMTAGASNYLAKPVDVKKVRDELRRCEARFVMDHDGRESLPAPSSEVRVVAKSPAMIAIVVELHKLAGTDLSVFITGPSGSGKEIVAQKLHQMSDRGTRPFVSINCSAIPDSLIESELFGHVRGAFSGADRDRKGLLEEAQGGTIFLDEITETSPYFQVKLLRALQDRKIRRVGSNTMVDIDVRVVSASNRTNIEDEIAAGRFREDLFYRLNGSILEIPPLRERAKDILPLVDYFAGQARRAVTFTEQAERALRSYSWPGNVRELKNAVEYAVKTCDGVVHLSNLPNKIQDAVAVEMDVDEEGTIGTAEEFLSIREITEKHIRRVLKATGGNKAAAGRILGLPYRTMLRLAREADGTLDESAEADCVVDQGTDTGSLDSLI